MFNTKSVETRPFPFQRVAIGTCPTTGATIDMAYIIHAEVYEETQETGMPWVRNIAPGVYYSFIGAKFIADTKLGESTTGLFKTLADVKQFAENCVNAARAELEAAAA